MSRHLTAHDNTSSRLVLTATDIVETRNPSQPQSMRWPVDEDTTRRLAAIGKQCEIRVNDKLGIPRRLLRWIKGMVNGTNYPAG